MTHKFVEIGDVVRLKKEDCEKIWRKVEPNKKYIVKATIPHPGFDDETKFITQLEDSHSNIINLKINERYFDVVWEDKSKKKFKVGDRVISVKNTPAVPEGFIGTVVGIKELEYPIDVRSNSGLVHPFNEDELELLSVEKDINNIKICHDSVGLSFDDPLMNVTPADIEGIVKTEPEYTGGSSSYYKVHVNNPTTSEAEYDAECNDLIEALDLTFAEGNIFKAIWRIAADRNGKKKKGNNSVYDAEKVVFFAERLLIQEKSKEGK